MDAYRWTTRIKVALLIIAVLISVASLAYTDYLVEELRDREQSLIQLWADAQEHVAEAQQEADRPYEGELQALSDRLRTIEAGEPLVIGPEIENYRRALTWAQSRPPSGDLNFITNKILIPDPFGIPAVITDSTQQNPLFWRNVDQPDTLTALSAEDSARVVERLRQRRAQMDEVYRPIPIEFGGGNNGQMLQYVHYDESALVRQLRWFPYVQLMFVGLFILVGYVGFSYIRKNEQSSLWVGMAREAAHQLGTPISSLMGWVQLLRSGDLDEETEAEAFDQIERDIERLQRVASRFSDIGSMPKLDVQPLAPLIEETTDYLRKRVPEEGADISINLQLDDDLKAPVNAELFEWVIENMLKNSLDAIETGSGMILLTSWQEHDECVIEVKDTGKGIERAQRSNIFRPGYSTKKRGWGLGLSLARRIIEDYHGGTLKLVSSQPGEGSTFRVQLPVTPTN